MKRAVVYLLVFLSLLTAGLLQGLRGGLPVWLASISLWYFCVLAGGFGGSVYCLRAVNLRACIHRDWDDDWLPWYIDAAITSEASSGRIRAGFAESV